MNKFLSKHAGVTLLEIMLVLAIIGGIMVMAINYGTRQVAQQRRDKTAMQIQQILNAGLAYYNVNGAWPVTTCNFNSTNPSASGAAVDLSLLSGQGYLPTTVSNNAFGHPYQINCDSVTGSVFYVITQISNSANALIVSGEVPLGYVSDSVGNPKMGGTYVTAQVTTPGQNLNNARSVNFSGIYHHGACVPVPACPGYDPTLNPPGCSSGTNCMTPQIMVAPISVSGVATTGSTNVSPISSFTAFATGPTTDPHVNSCVGASSTPVVNSPVKCSLGAGIASPSGLYWRVCMQVVTPSGVVSSTNTGTGSQAWGQYATMMVITRCTPPNEPYGSDLTVFTQ